MIYKDSQYHNGLIIDQLKKQAIPFTQNGALSAEYAVKRLLALGNVTKENTVLDVACGSGLLYCDLAKVARHTAGIDITPAMIDHHHLVEPYLDDVA